MRSILSFVCGALLFFSISAFAKEEKLFIVTAPANSNDLVQVFVNLNSKCEFGRLEYRKVIQVGAKGRALEPLGCTYERAIRSRVVERKADPSHKGSCANVQLKEGEKCFEKFYSSTDISYVKHDLAKDSLVVRAIQKTPPIGSAPKTPGECRAAAFLDVGPKAIQVLNFQAVGKRESVASDFFSGVFTGHADVQLRAISLTVTAMSDSEREVRNWFCPKNRPGGCVGTISVTACEY